MENKKYPKIVIQYARLIDPVFIFYCQNNPDLKKRGWNDWTPPNREDLDKRIKMYKEEWAKYNLVENISNFLQLDFKRDVIDILIVSQIPRPISQPIIIGGGYKPKGFVATLAHELIHRILTINKIKKAIFDEKESDAVNNHVIVYTVLKKILDDELWDITLKMADKHSTNEYSKAIALSEELGIVKVTEIVRAAQH